MPYSVHVGDAGAVCETAEDCSDRELVTCTDGICTPLEMVLVTPPETSFTMGDGGDDLSDWGPAHPVALTRPFFMDALEAADGRYPGHEGPCEGCALDDLSFYDVLALLNDRSRYMALQPCYDLIDCEGDSYYPGTCQQAFFHRDCLGFRLPTEAEWEYAARGGTTTRWYCGEEATCVDEIAWCDERGHGGGFLSPNEFGLYDMIGNASEWVWDPPSDYGPEDRTDPIAYCADDHPVCQSDLDTGSVARYGCDGVYTRGIHDSGSLDTRRAGFRAVRTYFPVD